MSSINETCWQTKAKREQAIKDAALNKERAEMQQKVEQRAAVSYANVEGRARKPNKWGKKQPETFDQSKETITQWLEKFTEELDLWYDKVHWLSQLLDCMPETTKDYLMAQRRKLPQNSLITQQHALALTLDSLPRDHNRPTAKLNEK